jgi:hypothetical protein
MWHHLEKMWHHLEKIIHSKENKMDYQTVDQIHAQSIVAGREFHEAYAMGDSNSGEKLEKYIALRRQLPRTVEGKHVGYEEAYAATQGLGD